MQSCQISWCRAHHEVKTDLKEQIHFDPFEAALYNSLSADRTLSYSTYFYPHYIGALRKQRGLKSNILHTYNLILNSERKQRNRETEKQRRLKIKTFYSQQAVKEITEGYNLPES